MAGPKHIHSPDMRTPALSKNLPESSGRKAHLASLVLRSPGKEDGHPAPRISPFALCTVDQVMAEERAASFAKRSIKTTTKLAGLKIACSMMDLTTLEGKDTPGKVAYLCRKALQPADPKYDVPPCGAVCVYPSMVRHARRFLGADSPVRVASVATGFPSGQFP